MTPLLRAWICASLLAVSATAHSPVIVAFPSLIELTSEVDGPSRSFQVEVGNATHKELAFSAESTAFWLTVSPGGGSLPGLVPSERFPLTITVRPQGLQVGSYTGTILINAPGTATAEPAANTPYAIRVSLAVEDSLGPPRARATPGEFTYNGIAGGNQTFSGSFTIANAGGGSLSWQAKIEPSTAQWLTIPVAAGTGLTTVTFTARTAGLPAGVSTAKVRVTSPTNFADVTVTLNLRGASPAAFEVSPSSLAMSMTAGASNPAPLAVALANAGESPLNWTASAATLNGGDWLRVSPAGGTNQGSLQVSFNAASLSAGTYAGRVTLTAAGATNSPVQIPVTLVVKAGAALVNAASFATGALAACSLATAFGEALGPVGPVAASGAFPFELGGTSVTVGGSLAPMIYSSSTQVSFQIPCGLTAADAPVRINYAGGQPVEFRVQLQPAAPGIFTVDGTRAAALNVDYSLNTPSTPAPAGGAIQLFMTGQGAVDPAIATGAPSTAPYPVPLLPVTARIGGRDAPVLFAGLAPGLVGLLQVNLEIPRETEPSAAVAVNVSVGIYPAKPVTISVSAAPPPQ